MDRSGIRAGGSVAVRLQIRLVSSFSSSPQALSSSPTKRHASCRRTGSPRMTATRAATDEADLTGADLTDLTGADLRSAKLDGADLRGAIGIDDLDI